MRKINEMYRGQRWRIEHVRDQLKKQLDAKNDGQIIYTLQGLTRTDPGEVEEILRPLAPDFAAWFKRTVIDKNSPKSGIEYLQWLYSYTDLWPEVKDAIEECKPQLIKALLQGIRSDDHEGVKKEIKQLKAVGIDWPEFKTITGSLMEEEPAKQDDLRNQGIKMVTEILTDEILKKHRGDIYAMYHMDSWNLNLRDFPEVAKLLDDRKSIIMKGILSPFADQSLPYAEAVRSAMFNIARMRKIGITWPELDVIENSVSKKKVSESKIDSKNDPEVVIMRNFKNGLLFGLRYMHIYNKTVKDMPEAATIINRHKDATIKKLLVMFKQEDPERLNELLGLLRSAGVNWKELDTIEKSFTDEYALDQLAADELIHEDDADDEDAQREHDQLYGREWRLKLEWQEHMRNLRHDIKEKNWDMVPLTLVDIGMMDYEDVLTDQSMRLLVDNRDNIIKAMLEEIKKARRPEMMLYAIQALNNVGINWPELDVMYKSLKASENKTRTDETDSPIDSAVNRADWMLNHNVPGGNNWAISQALQDLRVANVPEPQIHRLLEKHREFIIPFLDHLLGGNANEVNGGLSNLMSMKKSNALWPELLPLLDDNKDAILKAVLWEIANGSEQLGPEFPVLYKELVQLGVDWPEMLIIQRSLDANKGSLDESEKKMSEVERLISDGRFNISRYIHELHNDDYSNSTIMAILKQDDELIASWIDSVLSGANADKEARQMLLFMAMGGNWPHVKAALEKNRDVIIRDCLIRYRDALNAAWAAVKVSDIEQLLKHAKQSGYDWPEFDAILNSSTSR